MDDIRYKENGLDCVIRENHFGYLCGYIFIPEDHPERNSELENIDVHGGITYKDVELFNVINSGKGIWIGFDCAHYGDSSNPELRSSIIDFPNSTYKDIAYVRNEISNIIKQVGGYTINYYSKPEFVIDLPL